MNNSETFYATNPENNQQLEGGFEVSTENQIDSVVNKTAEAFDIYRKKDKNSIAEFLEQIADEIVNDESPKSDLS